MPQPLSRLFPKINLKSEEIHLALSANVIAIYHESANAQPSSPPQPKRRIPKEMDIIVEREFKFILRTRGRDSLLPLLIGHLKAFLSQNMEQLGISSIAPLDTQAMSGQ
ncbi:3510_t:CDS:2 [Acaulospora colombiana]|uniref:3510_t:CDS:1 n=1 Tax=Acaulospora colombiana TaxID=27376 RepID=A0ACA9MLP8_9GLOM|nr:3510_t:CDS:2 [Acaulospora colombiana]